ARPKQKWRERRRRGRAEGSCSPRAGRRWREAPDEGRHPTESLSLRASEAVKKYVILSRRSATKDRKMRRLCILRSFAVCAAQDDGDFFTASDIECVPHIRVDSGITVGIASGVKII